jgi:hypothetical protein
MYNLLYLAKGKFTWFSDGGNRPSAKTDHIVQMKERLRPEELFRDLPSKVSYIFIFFHRGILSRI